MSDTATTRELLSVARRALEDIGYQPSLLREKYPFTDFFDSSETTRRIDLAAFGQEPTSFRTACLGIVISPPNGSSISASDIQQNSSLGAPQVLSLHPDS